MPYIYYLGLSKVDSLMYKMTIVESLRESIWNQFGASLEMLENAILMCPEELWNTEMRFWYKAYHCIFWTDYYLTMDPKSFQPPSPFTISEFEQTQPEKTYSKVEILEYLQHCRMKTNEVIQNLTEDQLISRWINEYKNFSILEIILYNLRHIQHHTAQLNLLLRNHINDAPSWISQSKFKL